MMKYVFIIISTFCILFSIGEFDIYTRGIKCFDVDLAYYANMVCKLKAIRGKKGIIIGSGIAMKPVEHPFMQVKLLWKSSSQRYQPYLIDMNLDLCNTHKYLNTDNQILKRFLAIATNVLNPEALEALKGQCPMKASVNVTIDANRDFKPYIPPIVPGGSYKVVLHFHNNNKTLLDIHVFADLQHIGLSDSIKLG